VATETHRKNMLNNTASVTGIVMQQLVVKHMITNNDGEIVSPKHDVAYQNTVNT